MYISARERKVISLLLQTTNDVPIKEIAEALDVSSRTVHRDLKGIEQVLKDHDLTLKKKTGSGLTILGDDENRDKLKASIQEQKSVDYTPEERHVLILSRLLEAREPMKLLTLANELGVTVATVSHDLDRIEKDLSGFHLLLIRKRGYGVEVRGDEAHFREAISYLIMQHMSELDFLKLLRGNIQGSSDSMLDSVSDQLLGFVNKEKLTVIERTVDSIRPLLHYHLADSAYIGLVVHLALAIERLQQGESIQLKDEYVDRLRSTKEYEVACQVIQRLEELFELEIPKAETGYIAMHLMGAKVRDDQGLMLEDTSLSIAFKAKQLIEYVSKALQQDLSQSEQLLNGLVVHLKPSMYRLQQGMDINNPLREQIEEDYPELFTILQSAVGQVFPSLTFPKEETAFLVMHFASGILNLEESRGLSVMVVCSSGIGTAKILAAKLKQQFLEIEEVDHQSLFDLERISTLDYDLIVSTVPLTDYDSYVLVSPMLPMGDTHKLQQAIRKVKISKRLKKVEGHPPDNDETLQDIQKSIAGIQKYASVVSQILDRLNVNPSRLNHKKDILSEACKTLFEKGVLTNSDIVTETLLKREQVGGLGIPGTTMVLYHTRLKEVLEPSFTMITLDDPVSVKGMDNEDMMADSLILMLAPEDIEKEGLEVLSFLSSLLVEDPKSVTVFQSKDSEAIKHYISNQLNQFFKNKLS